MDPILTAAMNFGAMGIAFAAVYVLHKDAIKKFCEQQDKERATTVLQQDKEREANASQFKAEREINLGIWNRHLDMQIRNHETMMAELGIIRDKLP